MCLLSEIKKKIDTTLFVGLKLDILPKRSFLQYFFLQDQLKFNLFFEWVKALLFSALSALDPIGTFNKHTPARWY